MPSLKRTLDDLYDALVETPKNETKVKKRFNAVRDKLFAEYKNRDGTLTERNAKKFIFLQTVIAMLIVARDTVERLRFVVTYGLQRLNSNGRRFFGRQEAFRLFLQQVERYINDTQFFENIQLTVWELDDEGNFSIVQFDHRRLLRLINAVERALEASDNIEETEQFDEPDRNMTDAERALNNFAWRSFAGGSEVVPTDAEKNALRVLSQYIDPQHSTDSSDSF